jgi:hypothetical protein
MKKYLKIDLIILSLVTCISVHAQTTITPDNSNLQYQGRIDFSVPSAPVFGWPANSVKMKFTGTAVSLLITDSHADGGILTNYYDIILDNKIINALAMSNTSTQYELASNLVDKEHVIDMSDMFHELQPLFSNARNL